ncbi:MAG: hypothetical protein IJ379_03450 [Lachnospiraceae bacterium]|nr:hypothetical protein [Lachnospiraceae bacterium]
MKEHLKRNKILYLQAVIVGLLPLLCCLVTCAAHGYSLKDIYLPASDWNDELFYFKQVESMLEFGYPQGYFGFNESHALKLSFAAWSPVLVFPWLLFGAIFGWSMMSPIYCNILLMSIACVAFVLLVKPKWKQILLLVILFCVFTPFTYYMLRGMPECICFSMLILYYGVMEWHLREGKNRGIVWMLVIAGLLTLMRPYLILFMLYPMYLWIKKNRKWGILGSLAVFVGVGGTYFAINHYLAAEYFTPLFKTDWLEPFLQGKLFEGIKGVFSRLYHNGKTFLALTIEGLRSGLTEGAFFAGYLAIMCIFTWQSLSEWRNERQNRAFQYLYLAFCFLAMTIALILMYKMKEGSKHLLTFMSMGVFAISIMKTRVYKKAMFFAALCVYLYSMKATNVIDYQICFATPERVDKVAYWEGVFEEELQLSRENTPNYDNVVIWVFSDTVTTAAGEESVLTDWQVLYGLPKGFGISCCYAEYVAENLDTLKSRYLTIPVGGKLQEMCEERGLYRLAQDDSVCVYQLRE